LSGLGYRIVEGKNARNQHGYLAGTDEQRVFDLNEMIRNPEVKAIFCSRGGYGTSRILDKIDYAALADQPKIIVGYSDITALQLAIFTKTGLVTFSGPMVATELGKEIPDFTADFFWKMLMGPEYPEIVAINNDFKVNVLQAGTADGILLGGCLQLVLSLLGTPYQPDFSNAILFIEEICEDIYRLDRGFAQLRNCGILDRISGLVLGQFINCEVNAESTPSLSLEEMLHDYTDNLHIPIMANFPYGHGETKYTLPVGLPARLDAAAKTISFLKNEV
jgi:muramoyltetrapeptide carboxypeptidase